MTEEEHRNFIDALKLLKAGLAEMRDSWRQTTITDRDGMIQTLKDAHKGINDKQKIVEAMIVGYQRRMRSVQRFVEVVSEKTSALETIDTRVVPADAAAILIDARAALDAALRDTEEAFRFDW